MDHGNDPDKFAEDLMNIAKTTLSSKILVQQRDYFAKLAVEAVLRLKVSVLACRSHSVRSYRTISNWYNYSVFPGKWKSPGNTDNQEIRRKLRRLLS